MSQHKEEVIKRKQELLDEQMDKMWVSIYIQWNKDDPEFEDYSQIKYASGRVVTKDLRKRGKPTTTWESMRDKLFAFWNKS